MKIQTFQITITGEAGEKLTGLFDKAGNPLNNSCYEVRQLLAQVPSPPQLPGPTKPPSEDAEELVQRLGELQDSLGKAEQANQEGARALEAARAQLGGAGQRIEELEAAVAASTKRVEELEAVGSAAIAEATLEHFTVDELHQLAEKLELVGTSRLRKEELIAAIITAQAERLGDHEVADAEPDASEG